MNIAERAPVPEMPEHLGTLFEQFQKMFEGLSAEQKLLCRLMQAEATAVALGVRNPLVMDAMVRDAQIKVLQEAYDAGMRG